MCGGGGASETSPSSTNNPFGPSTGRVIVDMHATHKHTDYLQAVDPHFLEGHDA